MARKSARTDADDKVDPPAEIEKLSFEEAIERLEELIDQIESGTIGLEDSVNAYERGVALRKHCQRLLDRAEQRFSELTTGDETDDTKANSKESNR